MFTPKGNDDDNNAFFICARYELSVVKNQFLIAHTHTDFCISVCLGEAEYSSNQTGPQAR